MVITTIMVRKFCLGSENRYRNLLHVGFLKWEKYIFFSEKRISNKNAFFQESLNALFLKRLPGKLKFESINRKRLFGKRPENSPKGHNEM